MASLGKPAGNVALTVTFFAPTVSTTKASLNSQLKFGEEGTERHHTSRGTFAGVIFMFTNTFDMYLSCFAELATVLALSHWTALFLDFEKGTVSVFASR